MKLQFDEHLAHQREAIDAVVALFKGQAPTEAKCSPFNLISAAPRGVSENECGIGNRLTLDQEAMFDNLKAIQKRNGIEISAQMKSKDFTIEMETGTGKTYVYLRTIFELHKNYGFTKFVILVPSLAVKEGVYKTYQITHEHFGARYPAALGCDCFIYDSNHLTRLNSFAASSNIQIMIVTAGAINRAHKNNLYKYQEAMGGEKPIDVLKATKPILIIDEPQRVEGERGKEAIKMIDALSTFRYSATHKDSHHMIYCLNAIEAAQKGLVKKIEVAGLEIFDDYNFPYIRLIDVTNRSKRQLSAHVELFQMSGGVPCKKIFTLSRNDLLREKTKMALYGDMRIDNIARTNRKIMRISGSSVDITLEQGETYGAGNEDEIKRRMIQRTIKEHVEKERLYANVGIKVLSLFFIDKVAHYRTYDKNGKPQKGKYAAMFEEEYARVTGEGGEVEAFHNGYFAQDTSGKFLDTKTGDSKKDESVYNLIMKDKEKLLRVDEPLRFIFSHSALNEGWDNPNVFQICYLRDIGSAISRRQTLGRGLRLCVNQQGERLTHCPHVNRLTIIASESYTHFAKALQQEMEVETGVKFESTNIRNADERVRTPIRKRVSFGEDFINLWNKIKQKTFYNVYFDEAAMKHEAAEAIRGIQMSRCSVQFNEAEIDITKEGIVLKEGRLGRDEKIGAERMVIPDILTEVQNRTQLKRETILGILTQSRRLEDFLVNPRQFIDKVCDAINMAKINTIVDGVKYTKGEDGYTQELFMTEELERHEKVKIFTTFPPSFTIPTPLGTYNPDWAILIEVDGKERLYLIAETKAARDSHNYS